MDESKLAFWSGANYMKRLLQDSQSVTVAGFSSQIITVPHNLGHIPGEFLIALDIADDDTLWVNNPYYDPLIDTPPYLQFNSWSDENTLTISVENHSSGSKSGTLHWVIYMDYA